MIALSRNLKKLRLSLNLTQKQLAEVVCVQEKSYQAWERRNIEPPIDKLIKLASFYQLTVDELVNGEAKLPEELTMEQKLLVAPEHIKKAVISLLQL